MVYVLGVTGGICSGKSTVTKTLESYGAKVIDADKLGHEAYVIDTPCYTSLVAHFGSSIVNSDDRQIDRRTLGSIVFSDSSKMQELQAIVWPEIKSLIGKYIAKYTAEEGEDLVMVIEAAVMIEANWQDMCTKLWVVTVNPELAVSRIKRRNNLSEEEALKRVNAQISNEERIQHADVVVKNEVDDDKSKGGDQFKDYITSIMLCDPILKALVDSNVVRP